METAAQEVAAMIIGSSLIAHERARLKPGEALAQRISFIKTWQTLRRKSDELIRRFLQTGLPAAQAQRERLQALF